MKKYLILYFISMLLQSCGPRNNSEDTSVDEEQLEYESVFEYAMTSLMEANETERRQKVLPEVDKKLLELFFQALDLEDEFVASVNYLKGNEKKVYVLFMDSGTQIYQATFLFKQKTWFLSEIIKTDNLNHHFFKSALYSAPSFKYRVSCFTKDYTEIICDESGCDTSRSTKGESQYFVNSPLIYFTSSRDFTDSYKVNITGVGTGVAVGLIVENGCLKQYWDSSN